MEEDKKSLHTLQQQVSQIRQDLQLDKKSQTLSRLQQESAKPEFWTDDQHARQVMIKIAQIQEELDWVNDIEAQITTTLEFIDLTSADEYDIIKQDIAQKLSQLQRSFTKLQIISFLSGKYDQSAAVLSVHAGQGGIEAMDWAEMLLRMYTRYCERRQWKYEIVQVSRGEEAGIKGATIIIDGARAYGYLKHEAGTHRLVRQSPFNADNLRQTSFALVEILPQIQGNTEVDIQESDLEWQFFRSSGKGGQNVNKVSTAVRLKHLPSGIIIESQAERTQVQNRALALSLLQSKLWEKQQQQKEAELQKVKGNHQHASWGTQIRSYVLHPYQLVKDNRTDVETSNTQAVLDGDIDDFIMAEISLSSRD